MKKLYYFSKSKLQFIEIANFKAKLAGILSLSVVVFCSLLFAGYMLLSYFMGWNRGSVALKEENQKLKSKLDEVVVLYSNLEKNLDSLVKANDDLRITANLPQVSEEERKVGVGGGYFDNTLDFNENTDLNLNKALSYIDDVARKISFEKNQYLEIEKKLKENEKLYEAIPAILPCTGIVAEHGFGIRFHPILHVSKMHEGIDIITDIGTNVHASGKGVVDFVGYRGGYGLAVEVDHGFGYRTVYAHLSNALVKEGQKVSRGDLIAKTGNSGLSTGPHLHYEVQHDGVKINPTQFFFDDMISFGSNKNNNSHITKD